jgi:hypothetical protein
MIMSKAKRMATVALDEQDGNAPSLLEGSSKLPAAESRDALRNPESQMLIRTTDSTAASPWRITSTPRRPRMIASAGRSRAQSHARGCNDQGEDSTSLSSYVANRLVDRAELQISSPQFSARGGEPVLTPRKVALHGR